MALKGESDVEQWFSQISNVGFPIFVAAYLLFKLEPTLKGLQRTVTILTIVVAKSNGVDYEEAKRMVGNGHE